jgi:DNA-binding HxlR family transcriptional regulator
LNSKASSVRKPTKIQVENDAYKAEILSFLRTADAPKSIKELQAEIESLSELTNQRITHMLTDLRNSGKVTREYVKKVPYFTVA